jgi:hypothetical protein
MADDTDSPGLLQSVLGFFVQKRPRKLAKPASLRSRQREAWLRTDAFLQRDDLGEADPESVARTLRAFEYLVQDDSDRELDIVGILIANSSLSASQLPADDIPRGRTSNNPDMSGIRSFAASSRIRVAIRTPTQALSFALVSGDENAIMPLSNFHIWTRRERSAEFCLVKSHLMGPIWKTPMLTSPC